MGLAAKILAAAAAAYGVVVLAAFFMQRSLMYAPGTTLPTVPAGFTAVTLTTTDGLVLTSWYAAPTAPGRAIIVYFQGNAGTIADRVAKVLPFVADGHGVLLTGYRGYGGNPGTPTERGLLADARLALKFALAEAGAARPVVLFGESLGSGVAVQLAAGHAQGKEPVTDEPVTGAPVAAVVLEAPFTSAATVGQAAYPFLPVKLLIRDRFDSLARIAAIGAPLLIVHGERDRVVPVVQGRRLLAAAQAPKTGHFLPGAGHNDLAAYGAIAHERAFLRQLPAPATARQN